MWRVNGISIIDRYLRLYLLHLRLEQCMLGAWMAWPFQRRKCPVQNDISLRARYVVGFRWWDFAATIWRKILIFNGWTDFAFSRQASTIAGIKSIRLSSSPVPPRKKKPHRNYGCHHFWPKSQKEAITLCCGWIATKRAKTFASKWWTPSRGPFEMYNRSM